MCRRGEAASGCLLLLPLPSPSPGLGSERPPSLTLWPSLRSVLCPDPGTLSHHVDGGLPLVLSASLRLLLLASWVSGTQHWAGRVRAAAGPPGASPGASRGVDSQGTHSFQRCPALKFCEYPLHSSSELFHRKSKETVHINVVFVWPIMNEIYIFKKEH